MNFEVLIERVQELQTGEDLAQARHDFLVQFKEEFLREWNAENIELN